MKRRTVSGNLSRGREENDERNDMKVPFRPLDSQIAEELRAVQRELRQIHVSDRPLGRRRHNKKP